MACINSDATQLEVEQETFFGYLSVDYIFSLYGCALWSNRLSSVCAYLAIVPFRTLVYSPLFV